MTKREREALGKIIRSSEPPCVNGRSYDENMRVTDEGDDPALLDSEEYKKGWANCHNRYKMLLEFLATASPADLKKFGK